MKAPTVVIGFGPIVAFFLPGVVGLRAIAYVSPTVAQWFTVCAGGEQWVGAAFLITVASLVVGLFVSALRYCALDLFILPRVAKSPRVKYDWNKLAQSQVLAAFESCNEKTYYFFQFYGNTSVATVMLCVLRLTKFGLIRSQPSFSVWLSLGLLLAAVILCCAAVESYRRSDEVRQSLLGTVEKG